MARGKSRRSQELIDACIEILREIQPATVRAICYQLFNRGLIESMAKSETNRVGQQLTDARERGWLPYAWIVDETREPESLPSWDNREDFVEAVRHSYRKSHWALQPSWVEVWSEKGTIRGTLRPILREYNVPFRVMHGFTSTTTIGVLMEERQRVGRPFLALYVGDFDPSGLHMSEIDLPERITAHWRRENGLRAVKRWVGWDPEREHVGRWHPLTSADLERIGAHELADEGDPLPPMTIRRVALTDEDVERGDLLAYDVTHKQLDPRYDWYVDEYGDRVGDRAWELDAMNPNDLRARVDQAIRSAIHWPTWERSVAAEAAEADSLRTVLDRWNGSH